MKHLIALPAIAALVACVEIAAPGDMTTIPAALQGRWALTAADCIPGRADAKGLMVVSTNTLTFYESRGTLTEVAAVTSTSIRGTFAMSGEGMTWTRDMALVLNTSGNLVRTESGTDATPGPLVYARCV